MRLADYIETHATAIVDEAEVYARGLSIGRVELDSETLRDHLPQILDVIVADLRGTQVDARDRAEGRHDTPASAPMSPAQWHGQLRAKAGFSIEQLVAEFRVLRASVLRLWGPQAIDRDAFDDLVRFNEAIDQAIAESVAYHAAEADNWRNIFLGVLGHDLRGPLTSILLTSNLLAQTAPDTATARLARRLVMGGERLSTLLDDLLAFSRTSLGVGVHVAPKQADLARELQDEIDMLRMAWPGARIHFSAQGVAEGVYDASRVREAMANLVNNAVKHGDADGDVHVRLRGSADGVTLEVENHGAPIPEATLATMFDPLQRGASGRPDDGTSLGLGLFVVREIARAHQGDVAVTSHGGRTVFSMTLPAHVAAGADSETPA